MLANRFTALIDACALFGALKRNLLLSLAEADLYRLRWTAQILDEVERSIDNGWSWLFPMPRSVATRA